MIKSVKSTTEDAVTVVTAHDGAIRAFAMFPKNAFIVLTIAKRTELVSNFLPTSISGEGPLCASCWKRLAIYSDGVVSLVFLGVNSALQSFSDVFYCVTLIPCCLLDAGYAHGLCKNDGCKNDGYITYGVELF